MTEIPWVRAAPQVPMIHCPVHNAIWPVEVGPLKPRPPYDRICLHCIEERPEGVTTPTGTQTVESTRASSHDYRRALAPRVRRALEERERERAASGDVISGSIEESNALAEMDESRAVAIEQDHLPKRFRGRKRRRGYVPPPTREAQFFEEARRAAP